MVMDLREGKYLIVFGGTFDPPHLAHIDLPLAVMAQVGADALLYVPASCSPLKSPVDQTPAHHRLAMLRLALADTEKTHVLTDELDRSETEQPSYTIDTIEALRDRLGTHVTLRLLIGADQLRLFNQWKSPDHLIELAEPLVMVRPPWDRVSLLGIFADPTVRRTWSRRLVNVPSMEMSSTAIRRRVAHDQPITGLVAAPVESYIREHELYQGREQGSDMKEQG